MSVSKAGSGTLVTASPLTLNRKFAAEPGAMLVAGAYAAIGPLESRNGEIVTPSAFVSIAVEGVALTQAKSPNPLPPPSNK